jgi:hypothetical protein
MTGTIAKGNLPQAKERCKDCMALISKKGVWWCDEGNCPVQGVARCTEWDNDASPTTEPPHPDLVPDPKGGWTQKKREIPVPTCLDLVQRVFKLNAKTRICPVHGKVKVLDKVFNKHNLCGTEGLSCGHTLLINRRVGFLKEVLRTPDTANPRNWTFGGWALVFKQTHNL